MPHTPPPDLLPRLGASGRSRRAQHPARDPRLRRGRAEGRRLLRRARGAAALPRQRRPGGPAAAPALDALLHRGAARHGLARAPRALRHADADRERGRGRLRQAVHRPELGRARAARQRRRAPLPPRPRARAHHERPHDLPHDRDHHARGRTRQPALPVGVALLPFQLALLEWYRKSELSADRAGLLAMQDHARRAAHVHEARRRSATTATTTSLEEFLRQAAAYETGGDAWDRILKLVNTAFASTRSTPCAPAELQRWRTGGAYDRDPRRHYTASRRGRPGTEATTTPTPPATTASKAQRGDVERRRRVQSREGCVHRCVQGMSARRSRECAGQSAGLGTHRLPDRPLHVRPLTATGDLPPARLYSRHARTDRRRRRARARARLEAHA